MEPVLPFSRSYWVIPGQIMAGPYPGSLDPADAAQRLRALAACGIRHVINLMESDEVNHEGTPFAPYIEDLQRYAGEPVGFTRFPIQDGSVPSPELMHSILAEIDAALAAGRAVYIHCWGGKGRTGTAVGCYLVQHGLASPATVIDQINALRASIHPTQPSPETSQQCAFVQNWSRLADKNSG